MANKISCREGVYGGWQNAAVYLPKAGIKYMEIETASLSELQKAADGCRAKGVTPLSIGGNVDCMQQESIETVKTSCDAAKAIGVTYYFLSAHGEDRAVSMRMLSELGDYAAERDVTLCLETHPPFCLNSTEMLKTMTEVDHNNVRINFDTANIFYYNKNCESAAELGKVVKYVASVHLKDTDGEFHSENFPVFGEGVVNFKDIFKILHMNGFNGPLTMELEGPLLKGLDLEARHGKVVACMNYLSDINEA